MPDFLLELRSEEIPARMQAKARDDLARLFAAELAAAGLTAGSVTTYATPRRLALIARDLPPETAAVSEEVKGPRSSAPSQALEGFLRKTGLTREQIVERDGVLFAVIDKPGRPTTDVLAAAIPAIVRAFPWPKSMRWGAASVATDSPRWVRPLQGIVTIFGEEIVPVEVAGVRSSATTLGHRFHHPGPITLGGAHDYVEKLRACHVIVDQDERAQIIRTRAAELARDAGLELIEDEGLVAENAGLTEWPVPLLGRFDSSFLEVPPEVIQLTARVNQKYFVCRGADGRLADAFICTANIAATEGGAKIVEGNRKVLAARLADAKFFWSQDASADLKELSLKLARIKYLEGLGTYEEKQHRIGRVVEFIEENVGDEISGLWWTAEKSKLDLVSGTVGEFPELQGVVGSYLLSSDSVAGRWASALKSLYFTSQQITADIARPASNALQIADRLDTVVAFATAGVWFKGSGDPYGIRQAAQAAISAILKAGFRLSLRNLITQAYVTLIEGAGYHRDVFAVEKLKAKTGETREVETVMFGAGQPDSISRSVIEFSDYGFRARPATLEGLRANGYVEWAIKHTLENYSDELPWFAPYSEIAPRVEALFIDRLKVQQREAGVRHDLIDAVFALGGEDDLVRLLARVRALQAFVGTEDGANLLAGYKRAANILKKEGWTSTPLPSGEGQAPQGARGEGDGHEPSSSDPYSSAAFGGSLPLPRGDRDLMLSYTPEPEEAALRHALDSAEPRAAAAVEAEEFEGAMAALASLRAPIDAFFDKVTVNDPDPARREARLNLLARVRDAVHRVADFSKIEG